MDPSDLQPEAPVGVLGPHCHSITCFQTNLTIGLSVTLNSQTAKCRRRQPGLIFAGTRARLCLIPAPYLDHLASRCRPG